MTTASTRYISREINFMQLESDPKNQPAHPPDRYFSDYLFTTTGPFTEFEGRLAGQAGLNNGCVCALLYITTLDSTEEQTDPAIVNRLFQDTFGDMPEHEQGIWEHVFNDVFAMAFFNHETDREITDRITRLGKNLFAASSARLTAGISFCPAGEGEKVKDTFENAVKALDHAAFSGPGTIMHFDAVSLNICGDRRYQLGHCLEASLEYKKGLVLDPDDINLRNSLGVCYGVMNDLDKAAHQFQKALEINPDELMVLYNTGLVYSITRPTRQAIDCLEKAHAISKKIFEIEYLLGTLLLQEQDTDTALYHLEKACRLNPDAGAAHRSRGMIYLENGELEKAVKAFTKAIKLNPEDAQALSGAAAALERQNRNLPIALTFARKSTDLEPDNALFSERLDQIQTRMEATQQQQASGY